MSGFLAIQRRFFSHWMWEKRREFSEAEAWLDLLQAAQWQPCKQLVKGKLIEVGRGQLLASNRYLQERWGWKSLTKVQSYIKMLCDDGMIRSEFVTATSRITICKYDTYNPLEVAEKSDEGHRKVTERSQKGHREVAEEVKDNNKQEKQRNKETTPTPQAGGFDFEKLAKQVGPVCAKLIIDGSVGNLIPDTAKKKQLVKWANHKFTSGNEIRTTAVLMEVVKKFQDNDLATLTESVGESISGNYARLVIAKQKATDKTPVFPNHWKPGIEAELRLTPEQTTEYYRHLIALGWYKTTEQGKPYWNRPAADTAARTGAATLAQNLKA